MKKRVFIGVAIINVLLAMNCKGGLDYGDDNRTCRVVKPFTKTDAEVILRGDIPSTVKTLDFTGIQEVNDDFIRALMDSKVSPRIVNLKLSHTGITQDSVRAINDSRTLGTLREMMQVSEKYNMPASQVFVDVRGTQVINTKLFETPVERLLKFHRLQDDVQTFPDAGGIRSLTFRSDPPGKIYPSLS